jgi:hypothetical protein
MAGGFVLTALYVFGVALPFVSLQLPSNTIVVIAVSLIGGFAGSTAVLEWGWKKLKS